MFFISDYPGMNCLFCHQKFVNKVLKIIFTGKCAGPRYLYRQGLLIAEIYLLIYYAQFYLLTSFVFDC